MPTILVVDDEPAVRSIIKLLLDREGYAVVLCADGRAALDILPNYDFATALIDLGLEPVEERHVIESIREAQPALPIVVMSGDLIRVDDDSVLGLPSHIDGLHRLPKPFKPVELIELVNALTSPPAQIGNWPARQSLHL
jgi:DNA-binding response OmpR family regulator